MTANANHNCSITLKSSTHFIPLRISGPNRINKIWSECNSFLIVQADQLGVIGGMNAGDCARRVAKRIISRRLAMNMNFSGTAPKIGLQHTTILDVIKGMPILPFPNEANKYVITRKDCR